MTEYLSIAEARQASGLRLVGLRGVPSPWTEAARGIFHVKGIPCRYAAPSRDEPDAIADWAGNSSIPVVAYEGEKLRTGWAELLLLAERLAPQPALIPGDAEQRATLFGLGHEICGEIGLGWCARLLMIERSLGDSGGLGFPPRIAAHLAGKCGHAPGIGKEAMGRVRAVLAMLDARLARHPYLLRDTLTVADIYWATFANLITPLPEDQLTAAPRSVPCTRAPTPIWWAR
jgi:glutathione S-transferase